MTMTEGKIVAGRPYAASSLFMKLALAVAVLAVAANAVMLAVNDRRYCSPLDISFPRARNDAAAEVVSRGGGKVVSVKD